MNRTFITALFFGASLVLSVVARADVAGVGDSCDIKDKVDVGRYTFRGTDTRVLVDGYQKLKPKDSFETTQAFNARRAQEIAAIATGPFCVVANPSREGDGYDADHQRYKFFYNYIPVPNSWVKFKKDTKILSSDDAVGSNAYGVTSKYKRTAKVEYGVAFEPGSFVAALEKLGASEDRYFRYHFTFPMKAEQARAIGTNGLQFLFVYQWVSDYIQTGWEGHVATLDEPYQEQVNQYFVKAKVLRVIVFDKKTGEILVSKAVGS